MSSLIERARASRGFAPRVSSALAVSCGALVVLLAILLGEQLAARAVKRHEQLIGQDLAASIDRVLDTVISRRPTELAALAGQPCSQVERRLAKLETKVSYVRAIALVANGRVYCSSAMGPVDHPCRTIWRHRRIGTG
jgi:sensor c-di-GMP phosphodiesterase-like protein